MYIHPMEFVDGQNLNAYTREKINVGLHRYCTCIRMYSIWCTDTNHLIVFQFWTGNS